jgi:hypothetical protein
MKTGPDTIFDVPYNQGVSGDMWDMSFMAALGMRSSR